MVPPPETLLRTDDLASLCLAIARSSSDVIYAKDRRGCMLFANPATLALIGKPEEEVIGRTDREFLNDPQAAARVMANDQRIMDAGVAEEIEESVPMPDGTQRIWCSRKVPYRDASGKVVALLGISHDITRSKQLESELRQSSMQLSHILGSITDGLAVLDDQWRYTHLNPAGARLLGVQPEDLLGRNLWELYPEADNLKFGAAYRQAMETQTAVYTEDFYPAPLNKWVECHCYPSPQSLSVFFRDATERHRAREALERSEERLRQMFELNPTGVVTGDASGRLHDANSAFLRIIGRSREDLAAGQIRWNELTPIEHADKDARAIAEVAQRGVSSIYEKEYFRADGTRVPVMIACARFDRGPEEMVAFVIDISERKRAEERLRDADRQKDRFLATLAHELRNPLAPIRASATLLGAPGVTAERVDWARRVIERQVGHMAVLLDDLLDISRITVGKLTLRRQNLDLSDVVERALEACRPLITEKKHSLTTHQPDGLRVDADPVRLAQVLTNLLINAAKYTPPGGHIALRITAEGADLSISVRDSGIGIDPAAMPRLFQMFSQLDGEGVPTSGGLGIGLALTRGLVELHGGSIRAVSSGLQQGSEFIVDLPGLVISSAVEPTFASARPAVGCSLRVLIADDNRDAADSLGALLETLGHEVQLAYGGLEAVEKARQHQPTIVLLDLGMPDLDGYAAARQISALSPRPDRIVALSGWGQKEHLDRAASAGFDLHFTKPVDPSELERLLVDVSHALRADMRSS